MPTLLQVAGYRVMILTNDHPPPHVHAMGRDGHAKIRLDCTHGSAELLWHEGIQRSQLRLILETVEAEIRRLCDAWRTVHG